MSNTLVKLGSGHLVNVANVTQIIPVEKKGLLIHFVDGRELTVSADDSITFLTDLREVTGIEVEPTWMMAFLGKERFEEWRKKNPTSQRKKPGDDIVAG